MLRALPPTMEARLLVSTSIMATPQLSRTSAPTLTTPVSSMMAVLVTVSLVRLDTAPVKPYYGSAWGWTLYMFTVEYPLSPIFFGLCHHYLCFLRISACSCQVNRTQVELINVNRELDHII